jgi:uncharacterized metal-binding protein YceD (DUF177 family)
MIRKDQRQAEFTRFVARDRLADDESELEIEANAAERQALARRFGLLSLDLLRARLHLRRGRGGALLRVTGHLEAELQQACVVTLEPVRNRIEEELSLSFSLETPAADSGEVVIDVEGEEPPEPVAAEGLDLGEVVAQQLALAIDPYPRAQGASLDAVEWPGRPAERAGEEGPFAALKPLKERH